MSRGTTQDISSMSLTDRVVRISSSSPKGHIEVKDSIKRHQSKIIDLDSLVILGAGSGGVFDALEHAKRGIPSIIIDKNENLFDETPQAIAMRLGVAHYRIFKTNLAVMEHSIKFGKRYSKYFMGDAVESPLRRCLYICYEKSPMTSEDKIAKLAEHIFNFFGLRMAYQLRCEKDPSDQIFGKPENFVFFNVTSEEERVRLYAFMCQLGEKRLTDAIIIPAGYFKQFTPEQLIKVIDPMELKKRVNLEVKHPEDGSIEAILFVDVAEHFINMDNLKRDLKEEFEKQKNITFLNRSQIVKAEDCHDGSVLLTVKKQDDEEIIYRAKNGVHNSLWAGSPEIDVQMGFQIDSELIRLKEITRPPMLEEFRNWPSMMAFGGRYAATTNIENMGMIVTYEPKTEIGRAEYPESKEALSALRNKQKDFALHAKTSVEIIEGATLFFPPFQKILDKKFVPESKLGWVRSSHNIDERQEKGIIQRTFYWDDVSSIKLTYGVANSEEAVERTIKRKLVDDCLQVKVKEKLQEVKHYSKDSSIALTYHLKSRYFPEDFVKSGFDARGRGISDITKEEVVDQNKLSAVISGLISTTQKITNAVKDGSARREWKARHPATTTMLDSVITIRSKHGGKLDHKNSVQFTTSSVNIPNGKFCHSDADLKQGGDMRKVNSSPVLGSMPATSSRQRRDTLSSVSSVVEEAKESSSLGSLSGSVSDSSSKALQPEVLDEKQESKYKQILARHLATSHAVFLQVDNYDEAEECKLLLDSLVTTGKCSLFGLPTQPPSPPMGSIQSHSFKSVPQKKASDTTGVADPIQMCVYFLSIAYKAYMTKRDKVSAQSCVELTSLLPALHIYDSKEATPQKYPQTDIFRHSPAPVSGMSAAILHQHTGLAISVR